MAQHDIRVIREKFEVLAPILDERLRRLWAAAEARSLGWGGVTAVAKATGLARNTIAAGLKGLSTSNALRPPTVTSQRRRRAGGGRKRLTEKNPELISALRALVESTTRGDPESPLRWTCKSTSQLARELERQGHRISKRTVAHLLHEMEYSLQANRKTAEGTSHRDRNKQFEHIAGQTRLFQERGLPVVSVDAKKKELVGRFKNNGQEWRPKGQPEEVNVYDFPSQALGKAIPYGVYDLTANGGWVNVGVDHDTSAFAVGALRAWWTHMGSKTYPEASELLIMADCGGSNGYRRRAWKTALQGFATATGLRVSVCHFPPGTSKWNKIEHRMFCHMTQNWRGRPLESYEVIVNLIGHTTTTTGLRIQAQLDEGTYPTGIKVTDDEMARVRLVRDDFHGEWNYTILPE